MSEIKDTPVKNLELDLHNFRTVPQTSENKAISTMISISPDYFWGLTKSLLEDGYIPTENIIVQSSSDGKLVVREGNRRVAALKLIHGIIAPHHFDIPDDILEDIKSTTTDWKKTNSEIPCIVYNPKEKDAVDRIVTRIHGKGDKASRENWKAIARARHNRDENGKPEPALDLFEKYLKKASNLTDDQRQRWSGNYAITVLDEAIKKIAKRFGASSAPDLVKKYPSIKHHAKLDAVMRDIGLETLGFKGIRAEGDFLTAYGMPPDASSSQSQSGGDQSGGSSSGSSTNPGQGGKGKKTAAVALDDPRAVKRALRSLTPQGQNREKVVSLKLEALNLNIVKTKLAFCFVLRSMFEISAKMYCADHKSSGGPSSTGKGGVDRPLAEVLKDIVKHMTKNNTDKAKLRELHGASVELSKSVGILSVTSMNQLVHNPKFTISPTDLCSYFAHVFPLLREMNE